ncbi:hypothetical protein FGO68_gene14519 [Halteria grandinella]|uniref:Protein yippee-like n=1 Tax=Halteria grandinella TaxID=5974 RepID=A0A8J8P437_HALGN|nr:hypothetical protein FGO68_gene14519 [Halteria grandinella]
MGRLYLQYLHDDYILTCKSCETHLATIDDNGCPDVIRLNHSKSGFKPKKVVNCKLEKGTTTPFSNGYTIDIKCIMCLEIVGRVDKQHTNPYNSVIFNVGLNPEETAIRVFQGSTITEAGNTIDIDQLDIQLLTMLMSKVTVKRMTPEKDPSLISIESEESTEQSLMQQFGIDDNPQRYIQSTFYREQDNLFNAMSERPQMY